MVLWLSASTNSLNLRVNSDWLVVPFFPRISSPFIYIYIYIFVFCVLGFPLLSTNQAFSFFAGLLIPSPLFGVLSAGMDFLDWSTLPAMVAAYPSNLKQMEPLLNQALDGLSSEMSQLCSADLCILGVFSLEPFWPDIARFFFFFSFCLC